MYRIFSFWIINNFRRINLASILNELYEKLRKISLDVFKTFFIKQNFYNVNRDGLR